MLSFAALRPRLRCGELLFDARLPDASPSRTEQCLCPRRFALARGATAATRHKSYKANVTAEVAHGCGPRLARLGSQSPGIKQRLSPHLTPSTRAPQVLSSTRAPTFTHTRASHAHARHRRARPGPACATTDATPPPRRQRSSAPTHTN